MDKESSKIIAKSIVVVGLAAVSVYAWSVSEYSAGLGWTTLSFLTWAF